GRVWKRDHDRVVDDVALADALVEAPRTDDRPCGEPANRDHELRAEQPQLRLTPGRAQPPLGRGGRAITTASRAAGVAASDGGAKDRLVERPLVELEPPPQRRAGAPAPGSLLGGLHDAGRLTV